MRCGGGSYNSTPRHFSFKFIKKLYFLGGVGEGVVGVYFPRVDFALEGGGTLPQNIFIKGFSTSVDKDLPLEVIKDSN